MKNNKKTPEIRFKGFTDDWEQRKLDDVITRISTGLNPRDNFVLNNGGYNYYVTIKNFTHGNLKLDSNCDMIDNHAMSIIQKRSDLKKDDILFSSIGRIGDCYLLRNTPKNWNINESVFTFRPNKEIVYPEYLFHTIHSDSVLNQILGNVTGSTFKSIKIGDLKKANISITNKEEQLQLSKFISNIDKLITLHQRKYEKLKNIKQSLLEKMFPKNGMKIPEIRFKGFTDDWEQRKFDEITKITMGQSPKSNNYTNNPNDCLLIQGNADLDSARVVPRIWTTEITKKSYPNDIIFTVRAPVGEVARSSYFSTIGRGVCAFKGNEFLYQELVRKNEIKFWEKLSSGSTFDSINSEQLKNIYINMPKEILEQDKIGKILGKLDNLITLHQRKYEKLKNIKQALLDKMFV